MPCCHSARVLVVGLREETVPGLDLRETLARPLLARSITGDPCDDDLLEVAERPRPRRVEGAEPAEGPSEVALVLDTPGQRDCRAPVRVVRSAEPPAGCEHRRQVVRVVVVARRFGGRPGAGVGGGALA